MSSLLIVPIGSNHSLLLPALAARLESIFHLSASIAPRGKIDPSAAFNVSRNQYSSTQLVLSLVDAFPQYDGKLLGVTSLDLYVPILKHVFGEAQLNGRCAVISFHRLDDTLYGFPPNQRLLQARMHKEAIHQLGHTFGLLHCENHQCTMYSSTEVAEVDVRTADFCSECGQILKQQLGRGDAPGQ